MKQTPLTCMHSASVMAHQDALTEKGRIFLLPEIPGDLLRRISLCPTRFSDPLSDQDGMDMAPFRAQQ